MKIVKKISHGARQLIKQLKPIFNKYNSLHAKKGKSVSKRTQTVRWQIVRNMIIVIHDVLGYKIQTIDNIKQKHIISLASYWEFEKQYSAGTIQNNLSVLRTFFHKWLGKSNFVPSYDMLFSSETTYKRRLYSGRDKSWTGNAVDIGKCILNVFNKDERVAIQLLFCAAFGLRVRESVCCHPHEADLSDCIMIKRGSKGGRYREVIIDHPFQRHVIELMKAYSYKETSSTIPPEYNLRKWLAHFYYVIREYADLTNKGLGVTPNGLRHEYAINKYELLTGLDAPARKIMEQTTSNKEVDRAAREIISELLGHSRPNIVAAYIGPLTGRHKKK